MIEFVGGLILGAMAGWFSAIQWMHWQFLNGRITQRSIAEYCDQIIDAQAEATEEPVSKRRAL